MFGRCKWQSNNSKGGEELFYIIEWVDSGANRDRWSSGRLKESSGGSDLFRIWVDNRELGFFRVKCPFRG